MLNGLLKYPQAFAFTCKSILEFMCSGRMSKVLDKDIWSHIPKIFFFKKLVQM